MKTIVSVQEISEFEIKPHDAVEKWRELVETEISKRWAGHKGWIRIGCPACGQSKAAPAFKRFGIDYAECKDCGTLYAPERPGEAELRKWYRESEPARYWREQILPASEDARREKITRPRADWILDGIAEYAPSASRLVDVSPHGRALIEMVSADNPSITDIVAAGMTADMEGDSTTAIRVKPCLQEELAGLGAADVIVAVDALDRASDLSGLVGAFGKMLVPGGVVFATAPVASGFEVQVLWERSPTVIPPDKLNLPSTTGLQKLFSGPEWELIELSLPGMFDVELVRRAIKAEPDADWPRVVRALVEKTDSAGRMALVEFLQARRLTSFARIVARRKA